MKEKYHKSRVTIVGVCGHLIITQLPLPVFPLSLEHGHTNSKNTNVPFFSRTPTPRVTMA